MADKELDFNRMISINSDGDKTISLSIGVYQGNASLVVFSNKQLAAKFSFPRSFITKLKLQMISLISAAPGTKVNFTFSKWDADAKKSITIGNLIVGKDDKSILFFGVQVPNHPSMKFPMKSQISFDLSEPMSDPDRSVLAAQTIIDQLATDIPMALQLTSFKRDPNVNRGNFSNSSATRSSGEDIF